MTKQESFSGAKYFEWTNDDKGIWYSIPEDADKRALKARNARAKELKKQGYKVTKWSLGSQLMTKGGIGTGKPQIDFWVKCYMLDIIEPVKASHFSGNLF